MVFTDFETYMRISFHLEKHQNFIWKGTAKLKSKGVFGPILQFNHLKLIVITPGKTTEQDRNTEVNELCLAKFTCVAANAKQVAWRYSRM
jgi:hypothetical protein